MTAGHQLAGDSDWFKPGTYSVWAEKPDPDENHLPALIVLYEWEIEGLRGLSLEGVWGALSELDPERSPAPESEHEQGHWSGPYDFVYKESRRGPEFMHSLGLAEMIHSGALKRIGEMPALPGFTDPPREANIRAVATATAPSLDKPVDSHP